MAHRPRKRFGQHFLTDPGVVDEIVRSIRPASSDIVVEIGPGLAAITAPLLADAGRMHAIELDRDLAAQLRQRFQDESKLTIHEADALRFDYSTLGEGLRVVGNLPLQHLDAVVVSLARLSCAHRGHALYAAKRSRSSHGGSAGQQDLRTSRHHVGLLF